MPFPEVLRGAREVGAPGAVAEEGKQSTLTQTMLPIGCRHLWKIHNTLPHLPRTSAKVNVLEEEEKPGIEGADPLKERATDEETRPHRPIDVADLLSILVPLKVPPHASGECAAQERPLDEEISHTGERAVGIPHGAILMEELRREDADARIPLHGTHHVLEAGGFEYIVRIDNKKVLSYCMRKSKRIPPSIADVTRGLENADIRKLPQAIAEHADGIIAGVVVDDEYFQHLNGPHP